MQCYVPAEDRFSRNEIMTVMGREEHILLAMVKRCIFYHNNIGKQIHSLVLLLLS